MDKGELELSSDYEEFYFDEEVVEDFVLEVMAAISKAGKQLVEDYEEKIPKQKHILKIKKITYKVIFYFSIKL